MGSVTQFAPRQPRLDPRLTITFEADGPFEALGQAREYLANREFSVGSRSMPPRRWSTARSCAESI